MDKIIIGKITAPVGLKGEVRIKNYSDSEDRYERLRSIFVGEKEYGIEHVRYAKGMPVIKLVGVASVDDAASLRGKDIAMSSDNLAELEDGSYYIRDLIGLAAYDVETGNKIGMVKDVLTDRPQDIYVIKLEKEVREAAGEKSDARRSGELLVPAVSAFIKDIDIAGGRIVIGLIEGML